MQTFGGTVAMEFGPASMRNIDGLDVGTYRRLGPLPSGLFVAYRTDAACRQRSGPRRRRFHRPCRSMMPCAERPTPLARPPTRSRCGDVVALGAAMDETFDQRASVMSLDPAHVEMIEVARDHGASANYTGSGGAVIVLAPDDRARTELAALGCDIVDC